MDLPALVSAARDLRLTTERLVLRRVLATDADALLAHEQDRRVMQWIRDPQPLAASHERIAAMQRPWTGADGEWLALAIEPRDGATMVGIVTCRVTAAANRTLELGYRLAADVHRRGYAFEACSCLLDWLFRGFDVHKVIALCAAGNEPSWRLMEKLGMRREACLREYTQMGGHWHDEFVYGLLAREWR